MLVVDESDRIGLLLDCSHLGKRSSLKLIERSQQPVVFSHSCAKALVQIKAYAKKTGIIGLSPWGPMTLKTGKTQRPTIDDFIDHIDYVALLLGSTDYMGVGTDMSLVADSLFNGHRFRALTIVDNYSRECLAIEAGQSITGQDVAAVMQRLVKERGVPDCIQCGSEFISKVLHKWPMIME